ncbi:hypothetical protein [Microbacterium sp. E-13]|uniref:hypothetical protein n=1 Tax=Microbacterium sp. E-13 TaxID=3404048 RepID=UPI003CF4A3E8
MTDLLPRTAPAPFAARGQLSELLLDILTSEPHDALTDGRAKALHCRRRPGIGAACAWPR